MTEGHDKALFDAIDRMESSLSYACTARETGILLLGALLDTRRRLAETERLVQALALAQTREKPP